MGFRQFDLVWARKPTGKRLWWPASILSDSAAAAAAGIAAGVDAGLTSLAVKFVGASYKKSICTTDALPFDGEALRDVRFKDQTLDLAVQEAVSMRRQTRGTLAKVICSRLDHQDHSPPAEEIGKDIDSEEKEEDMVDGWKDDFLASLEDEEDKENDEAAVVKTSSGNQIKKNIRIKPLPALTNMEVRDSPRKPLRAFFIQQEEEEEEEQLSDYEKIRQRNIAEQRAMFAELMACKSLIAPRRQPLNAAAKPHRRFGLHFSNGSRRDPVLTRRRNRLYSDGGSSCVTSEESTPRKRHFSSDFSSEDDDDDDESPSGNGCKRRRRRAERERGARHDPNASILDPDDVTEEMMENVADRVSEKIYDQERGTTCHQCRQKTSDTKTACRSGHCVGIRGMFCGVCLLNRYGESVREALRDPNWMCPPCLDVCNCSICRNRIGKGATGPITYLAHAKGFKSAKDFLDSLKQGHRGEEIFD